MKSGAREEVISKIGERVFYAVLMAAVIFSLPMPMIFAEPSFKDRMALATSSPSEGQRVDIRNTSRETLLLLYAAQPSARAVIKNAIGYATFSNFGMKIFIAGGGKGKGVAVNNKTRKEIFMKMLEVQAGFGLGVKSFRLIWVFDTQKAFDQFVNSGWELEAQATAAAQMDDYGGARQGALAISPGVWLYQLTDNGLALELTAKGTKYFRDDDLNLK